MRVDTQYHAQYHITNPINWVRRKGQRGGATERVKEKRGKKGKARERERKMEMVKIKIKENVKM